MQEIDRTESSTDRSGREGINRNGMETPTAMELERRGKGKVVLEGWLQKKSRHGLKHFRTWNNRYFLVRDGGELIYFKDMEPASFGRNIPLQERGCIDLKLLKAVYPVPKPRHDEARFDLQLYCDKDCPRYVSSPRNDVRKCRTEYDERDGYRIISLLAPSPAERTRWIEALSQFVL